MTDDYAFLVEMWNRATNCGTHCFFSLDELGRIRELCDRPINYRSKTIREWHTENSGRRWVTYREVHYVGAKETREVLTHGLELQGQLLACAVAKKLEPTS